jgi:hypothetical protein
MIYDNSKLAPQLANLMINRIAHTGSFFVSKIVIYSGSQPTAQDYATNWSTTYYLNDTGSTGTTASAVLCGYGNLWETTNLALRNTESSLYLSDANPALYSSYFNDGTAAWAVIFQNTAFESGAAPYTNYMIVPVTGLAGNGIVKLDTTTVSGAAPLLSAVGLTLSLGA